MRNKFLVLFLSLLWTMQMYSQYLYLLDKETRSPVSYVTIELPNGDRYYSDENGKLGIPNGIALLKCSHICYKDTIIYIKQLKSNKVYLTQYAHELGNITISAKNKKIKTKELGYTNGKRLHSHGGKNGFMMAVYIPADANKNKNEYIQAITADIVYDDKMKLKGGNVYTGEVRFDLRKPDTAQGIMPGNISLIGGGKIYNGKKKTGKKIIKLDYPIIFPKEGLFVIIEWIYPYKMNDKDLLDPHIRTTASSNKDNTWILWKSNNWKWTPECQDKGILHIRNTYLKGKILNAKLGVIISE